MDQNNQENQINIELSEDMAQGVYTNLAILTHSPGEFIADFVQMMPGVQKAKVRSRVIMTPQNAKRLVRALADNIKHYEQVFGPIQEVDSTPVPRMNFGPTSEA